MSCSIFITQSERLNSYLLTDQTGSRPTVSLQLEDLRLLIKPSQV